MVIDHLAKHDTAIFNYSSSAHPVSDYNRTPGSAHDGFPSFAEHLNRSRDMFNKSVETSPLDANGDNSRNYAYQDGKERSEGQEIEDTPIPNHNTDVARNDIHNSQADRSSEERRLSHDSKSESDSYPDGAAENTHDSNSELREQTDLDVRQGKKEQDAHVSANTIRESVEKGLPVVAEEAQLRHVRKKHSMNAEQHGENLSIQKANYAIDRQSEVLESGQKSRIHALHIADQSDQHLREAGAHSRNTKNGIFEGDTHQRIDSHSAHHEQHLEHSGKHSSHSDESARITLITRVDKGHHQIDIGELQFDSHGSGKSVQDFRNFLQQEISPTLVKHARFVFHNEQESEIRMLLQPAELGTMRVKLFMQNGILHGKITVDNEAAKGILENSLVDIQRALRENGLHSDNISVSLHMESQFQGGYSDMNEFIPNNIARNSLIMEQIGENSLPFFNSGLIDLYA